MSTSMSAPLLHPVFASVEGALWPFIFQLGSAVPRIGPLVRIPPIFFRRKGAIGHKQPEAAAGQIQQLQSRRRFLILYPFPDHYNPLAQTIAEMAKAVSFSTAGGRSSDFVSNGIAAFACSANSTRHKNSTKNPNPPKVSPLSTSASVPISFHRKSFY